MPLAKRIIPTLLFDGEKLIKGEKFNGWRTVGHVEQAAKIYAHRAVDEIVLLDITATKEGRGPNLKLIERISRNFFTPLTVGGGVRNVQDVQDLLRAGADKVSINTRLVDVCHLASEKFGAQAIVASIDVCDYDAAGLSRDAEIMGAGEVLLTNMDREGTMDGYDIDQIREAAEAISIPLIAHGGCQSYEDMHLALEAGASAVAAGALFAFTDNTPKGAALYLKNKGHEVRIP